MFFKILTRKKILNLENITETRLARVLSTFDLTALGIGSTLGVGVYVLAGKVAKDVAGPAVILSFFIAALASLFAGLCYAEFGARVPRAGSAYIYSYVCVGEFIAFVIGWNLILEYIIGAASVARGFTLYLDTLLNDTLKNTFIEIAPINIPYMSTYFDFFSFGCVLLLTVGLAFGIKESTIANNIFTTVNVLVVIFVVIAGSIKADINNWKLPAPTNVTHGGTGGFFPFGFSGVLKGAATCFYGFVGFDCIATTGEEVKNPQKSIPFAILLSLFIVFLSYFGTSAVITLMVPYYLEDINAPIPKAFDEMNMEVAKWIVTIGGMFGLSASLFGAMFPLPRIIYAMASDGLIFKFLGTVHQTFSTPVIGTITAGILTGLMGALFELDQLVNMMSIGTLMAYTIVATCVLLLRYNETSSYNNAQNVNTDEDLDLIPVQSSNSIIKQLFNINRLTTPTSTSQTVATAQVLMYCVLSLLIGLGIKYLPDPISNGEIWAIVLISVVCFCALITLASLGVQPQSQEQLSFKVPLTPLIPALSILVNIYLMLMLDVMTWIRFAVWLVVGLPMYFFLVHQNAQNSKKHLTNKTHINGFANGQIHNEFDANTNHVDILTEDAVIENLDRILSKEEENINLSLRKVSVDTVSVQSRAYHEENVVAIVHCEDNMPSSIATAHADITYTIPEENSETAFIDDDINTNKVQDSVSVEHKNTEDDTSENCLQTVNEDLKDTLFEVVESINIRESTTNTSYTESLPSLGPSSDDKLEKELVIEVPIKLYETKNDGKPQKSSEELVIIPQPPSLDNYEKYKTSTMPAIKIKGESRMKVALPLEDFTNNESTDEHVTSLPKEKLSGFKSKLEKILRKQIPSVSSNNVTTPNSSYSKDKLPKTDIENKLNTILTNRTNRPLKRIVSEGDLVLKNKVEIEKNNLPEETEAFIVNGTEITNNSTLPFESSDTGNFHNRDQLKKKLESIFGRNNNTTENPPLNQINLKKNSESLAKEAK